MQAFILGIFSTTLFLWVVPSADRFLPLILFVALTGLSGVWCAYRFAYCRVNLPILKHFVAGLVVGFVACFSALSQFQRAYTLLNQQSAFLVTGYICEIPQVQPQGMRFDFCITEARPHSKLSRNNFPGVDESGVYTELTGAKIRLSWRRWGNQTVPGFAAGETLQLDVKLKPPRSLQNPGGFDYARWLVANGYVATGYIKSVVSPHDGAEQGAGLADDSEKMADQSLTFLDKFKLWILKWRINRLKAIQDSLTKSDARASLQALALGYRGELTDQQWQAGSRSGTAHLLSISGLHIGLAAIWGYWLVMMLIRPLSRFLQGLVVTQAAWLGAWGGAVVMTLLSGCSLPSVRAWIMISSFSLLRFLGLRLSLWRNLGVSAAVVLIIDPFAILSAGFWLSFCAVGLIAWLLIAEHNADSGALYRRVWRWCLFNGKLYLGLLPLSALIFGFVSLSGWLANLILIPITSFISLPLSLIGSLTAGWFDSFADPILHFASFFLKLTGDIQQVLAEDDWILELSAVNALSVGVMVITVIAILFLLLPKGLLSFRLKAGFLTVVIMVIAHPLIVTNRPGQEVSGTIINASDPRFRLLVFDIGQGLATVMQVGDHTILYDTGYGNADFSRAQQIIIPWLKQQGIIELSYLITSHADADHAGGADDILTNLSVSQWLSGEPRREIKKQQQTAQDGRHHSHPKINVKLIQPISCHDFPKWQWHEVSFHFVNRHISNKDQGNNSSCVLSVRTPYHHYLLPGDIEKKGERQLIKHSLPPVDVLVAPHHGSLSSSSKAFLEMLNPKWVVFSTGFHNQWHFPRPEVLNRYLATGSQIHNTAVDGFYALTELGDGKIYIERGYDAWPHFWRPFAPSN